MRIRLLIYAVFLTASVLPLAPRALADTLNYGDDRNFYGSYRHYNLIHTAGEEGRLETTRFGGCLPHLPYPEARLRWEYMRNDFTLHERQLADADVSATGRRERGRVGLLLPTFNDKLVFDISTGISGRGDRSRMIYANRVMIHPVDCARFEFHLAHRGDDIDIDGIVLGESIPFSVQTDRTQSGFTGEVRLWADLSAVTGYTDYQFDENDITETDRFGSLLLGAGTYRYHGLSLGKPDGYHVRLIIGEYSGRGRLDLYSGGTRFGQIAKLQAKASRWKIEAGLSATGDRRIILERFSADAEMTGHVESWPFTDPLVDLLGLRRNFKAKADAVIWHASGRDLFVLPHDVSLITEIDLFRVYPQLHWADWMPAYMVFGVADMDHYYDEYDRLDFGRLNLQLSRQIGRFVLNCRISQLFPIKLKKSPTDDQNAADNEPDPGPDDSADSGSRDDGGRTISLRIGYNF